MDQRITVSDLIVHLPNSLHKNLQRIAAKEGVSINQLITSAVAEKISALETEDYLNARAERANREAFEAVLKSAPDAEPELEADRL
jgi:predicted DNA-binding ribbon-helix-helix protein